MTYTTDHQPGGLYIQTEGAPSAANRQPLAFPLKHTDVQAKIAGNVSRVEVTQRFENPFTTTLEAVYIFPLPDEAAVDDMVIKIGDRTIQGSIKKRQEAQQIYERAKQQGQTAGLLEQERDNIFTQSLANIKPGEAIDVIIRYTESLKFEAGNYEFVFPMVVGPRYIPGVPIEENAVGSGSAPAPMTLNQDTDLVSDASRLNAPIVPAGTRSRHDINVTVEIDAGEAVAGRSLISQIASPSHQIQIDYEGAIARIALAAGDTIPNKDLILRYQVSGRETQTTLLTQADDRGGHFALYLIPAIQYQADQLVPKDVVFLIDTSGSQAGAPLAQCKELMRRFIKNLNPNDTFSIIDFSDTTQQLSPVPLPNTPQNLQLAIHYVNQLTAGGGTQLLRGIRSVLNFPVTDRTRLRSIVLLTDGYIGNENQVSAEVQRQLQPSTRLYSFGAGSSVNRFLLNRIAEIGRGISRIIRHDEPCDRVAEQFFRQINNPVLTNIQWQWEGAGAPPTIYPAVPPDLFTEQPLVLFGHKSDRVAGKLHLSGMTAGGIPYQQTFSLNFAQAGNRAIAQLWGRARLKDLMNQMVSGETKRGVEALTETALAYQLLSQYTAFVAVSDEVRVNPTDASVSVQVPVEMPESISYEGVFGGAYNAAPPMPTMAALSGPVAKMRRAQPPQAPMSAPSPAMPPAADFDLSLISPSMIESDPDDFDLSLISPRLIEDDAEVSLESNDTIQRSPSQPEERKSRPIPQSKPSLPDINLTIVSSSGLNTQAIASLTLQLQDLKLRLKALQTNFGWQGRVLFKIEITKGRVQQVLLDEERSSLQETTLLEEVRRSLLTWRPPQTVTGSCHLVLQIES